MKTWNAKTKEVEKNRRWYLLDAKDQNLGRFSTKIATLLSGKTKPIYTPYVDTGDGVVVINASKVKMTGSKWVDKKYYRRSRFLGSLKETSAGEMLKKNPGFMIENAVRGMLPKTKLGRKMLSKLRVYEGDEHPHKAQKPEILK